MMKRIGSLGLALALCYGGLPLSAAGEGVPPAPGTAQGEETSYAAYAADGRALPYGTRTIELTAADCLEQEAKTEIEGKPAVTLREGGAVSFAFTAAEAARYQLEIVYYPLEGKGASIQVGVLLDGETPFREAAYGILYRVWTDETPVGEKTDGRGNQMVPAQVEASEFRTVRFSDSTGVYSEPYDFAVDAGEHILTLTAQRENVAIQSIALCPAEELQPYEELAAEYAAAGYAPASVPLKVLEAEQVSRKSDSILYARSDKASPLTTPYSTTAVMLNTIGGSSWSGQGQWLEWDVYAPESGLYRLAFRARQNLLSGTFVSRRLYIDGSIPAREFADIRVNYGTSWQNVVLPYDIYLEKGDHTIRLEATIGALSDIVSQVSEAVTALNYSYRKIIMITGTSPDTYRDYNLKENVPEAFPIFEEQAAVLASCDRELYAVTGKRGSMNAILQTLKSQLEEFLAKPEKIQQRLGSFKSNIGSLSTWLVDIRSQSLELDKLYLYAGETALPRAEGSFLEKAVHEIRAFVSSFLVDYSTIGDYAASGDAIEVWVQTGRDQANIIKELLGNSFSSDNCAGVNLKLVQGQLLAATAAGRGPDAVLQVGASEPVNYAVRGAALDLSAFPDYAAVAARFRDSALAPYAFEGGIYALPETQTYQVMFYRSDILKELGLAVPSTWEELFVVLGRLQKNNMTVGIRPPNSAAGSFTSLSTMAMLLYQRGGELYVDGNRKSGLSSQEAQEAFSLWVSMYADYQMPVQYDAQNRFRTGEMPIVIEDFSLYNTLTVAAPEIRGMWSFTQVPGTMGADGSADHSVAGTGIGCMILSGTKNREGAWDFLKWWTSAETQTRYGKEIENQLGPSARYASANIEAFGQMPWSVEELNAIDRNWGEVRGIPEVAGGYFTSRHLNNAFRRVLNYGEDPKQSLLDYVGQIDEEILSKRRELGLSLTQS